MISGSFHADDLRANVDTFKYRHATREHHEVLSHPRRWAQLEPESTVLSVRALRTNAGYGQFSLRLAMDLQPGR